MSVEPVSQSAASTNLEQARQVVRDLEAELQRATAQIAVVTRERERLDQDAVALERAQLRGVEASEADRAEHHRARTETAQRLADLERLRTQLLQELEVAHTRLRAAAFADHIAQRNALAAEARATCARMDEAIETLLEGFAHLERLALEEHPHLRALGVVSQSWASDRTVLVETIQRRLEQGARTPALAAVYRGAKDLNQSAHLA